MATAAIPPQEPAASSPAPLSQVARIIDTFIAPTKTFTDIRRSASWWAPFLIIVVVSICFTGVVDRKVGFRKVVETQIELKPRAAEQMEQMPADQREKVMQQQVGLTKIITYLIPVIALLVYAVYAGVLFATLKFGASAHIKFAALFAVIVYSRLPELLRALLTILSLLAGVSGDAFNIENPVATNPGYFIDPSGSAVMRALLTPFDVLTFWSLILIAIGIPCISNVKRGTAFAVVFGWFAFIILARVGLAAAF